MAEGSSGNTSDPQSSSQDGPSSGSFSALSSVASPIATVCATGISLLCIALISYAWLLTDRFKGAPWWAAPAGIVIAAIPGGALGRALSQVGKAAVDRIPLIRK